MQKRFIIIFGILLLLLMPFIHADVAPFAHRAASLNFLVKYDSQTIEENFRADILICLEESCTEIDNSDECEKGICTFSYYRIERVPSEMRLQVSLNGKTFTSGTFNFSEKPSLYKYYYDVNINLDGKVTITDDNGEIEQNGGYPVEEAWWEAYYPVLRIFVCALVLTILIELVVLIIFLKRWKVKGWKRPILSLVLADVISVPLVWIIFFAILVLLTLFFQLSSIVIAFILAEAFAVVFEAYFIYWFNKKIISLKRLFILSVVMNVASLVIGGIILAVLSNAFIDSGSITETKPTENQFDASKYPVVIEGNEFPELVAFEKEISGKYETMLQGFAEERTKHGYEYECLTSPELSKLSFNYLKPKQDIYGIRSDCGIPGDTLINLHEIIFYANQGSIVMFNKADVTSRFTETFNNIETLDELKEYSELYVDELDISIDSALTNSLLDWSLESFEEDCPLLSDVPELKSTVSKESNNFVYEGLKIQPELYASLYYLKYIITPDGQVSKDKEEMLAMCENMGIIY